MTLVRELFDGLVFAGVLASLGVLFAAGLRLPTPPEGARRWLARGALIAASLALVVLANVALFKHDLHLDTTRESAFTPSREAQHIARALTEDVELVYFYQKQNPAARAAKTMLEILGRESPRLRVRTVDADQFPGLANQYGVRIYNAAVLLAGGRRIEVVTTDDRDVALALLRVTRSAPKAVCFATGHGEYDIDNFEFHTHFEGTHAHSHDAQGMAVIQTEQHGLGRQRRALEKLGIGARKITLATSRQVPEDCAALVEANPRTLFSPPESDVLRAYLERGGALLMLFEPGYPLEPRLAALLEGAGLRVTDGVVVDPTEHYFTDEQMVAISKYRPHAITQGLALSFFPGARPLEIVAAAQATPVALFSSSPDSHVIEQRDRGRSEAPAGARGARVLAAASEGRFPGAAAVAPYRMVVFGDADFASNSFFPYLSNADLVLGSLAWLMREEHAASMKPPVEVMPTVSLTNQQVRGIFIVTVFALPGTLALLGVLVWWRRRR